MKDVNGGFKSDILEKIEGMKDIKVSEYPEFLNEFIECKNRSERTDGKFELKEVPLGLVLQNTRRMRSAGRENAVTMRIPYYDDMVRYMKEEFGAREEKMQNEIDALKSIANLLMKKLGVVFDSAEEQKQRCVDKVREDRLTDGA